MKRMDTKRASPGSGNGLAPESANGRDPCRHIEDHIGNELRQLYAEALNEPIPDRILDLLKSLEDQEGGAH